MPDLEGFDPGRIGRPAAIAALVLGSAALYTASMVAMKLWDEYPPALTAIVIATSLVGAVWLEILVMREMRLGMVYLSLLATEAILIAGAAHLVFGETYTARELAGGALIVVGTALAAA